MAIQFKSATGFDYVSSATPLPVTIVGGGTGDVDGPASATDNAIVRFDGTTGKLIQNSVVTIADTTGAFTWASGQNAVLNGGNGGVLTLAAATTLVGGAGNMVITAGTGNSRTLAFQTTTAGGVATTALTLNADQSATFAAQPIISSLTASSAVATDASKGLVSVTNTGTGDNVLATSPTLVTPLLGTPTSGTLTNCTGLPVSSGISGLGTGIATALAVNTGSAGAPVLFDGALGTPSSGTVTNLTGTASININGTVGATTPAAGSFTTLNASGLITSTKSTAGVFLQNTSAGTNDIYWRLVNTSGDIGMGTEGSAGGVVLPGAPAYGQVIFYKTGKSLSIGSTGVVVQIADTGLAVTGTLSSTSTLSSNTTIRLKGYTVAGLPAGTQGDTAFVTDALAPTFLATVAGGGAVVTPVFYNGTNWVSY